MRLYSPATYINIYLYNSLTNELIIIDKTININNIDITIRVLIILIVMFLIIIKHDDNNDEVDDNNDGGRSIAMMMKIVKMKIRIKILLCNKKLS